MHLNYPDQRACFYSIVLKIVAAGRSERSGVENATLQDALSPCPLRVLNGDNSKFRVADQPLSGRLRGEKYAQN
jgi:hypothetical protein